jgi:hypothetical protein
MRIQCKRWFVAASGLAPQIFKNCRERFEIYSNFYMDAFEHRATNENPTLWQKSLQVTEDQRVERQQQTNGGARLDMPANPDWLVVILSEPRSPLKSLEAMEMGL